MIERNFADRWTTPFVLILALWLMPFAVANAQASEEPSSDEAGVYSPDRASDGEQLKTAHSPEDVGAAPVSTDEPIDAQIVVNENDNAINGDANDVDDADSLASPKSTPPEDASTVSPVETPSTESTPASVDTDRIDETDGETSAQNAPPRAQVSVSEKGLRVTSSDGRFALGLMPFVQMGYRQVVSDFTDSSESGFVLTHFRPTLTGKYTEYLSYNFILNITSTNVNILNAFVTFHAHERLNIRVGLQKPVFGIELRQAQPHTLFINRSMASTIGSARDIGLALDARPVDSLRIEAGVYNGTEDTKVFSGIQGRSVGGDAGVRWYALGNDRPATQNDGFLTFGAAALLRRNEGDATTSHLTARRSAGGHAYSNYAAGALADGRKFASTAFAHGGYSGLYFQGEFTTSNQQVSDVSDRGRIVEQAWAAAVTYTLGGITGWTGTTPNRSIFDGGLGALQIKARGHGLTARSRGGDFLDLGGSPADSLSAIGASAGLSWFLSPGFRVLADYNWTTFGSNAKRLDNATEHILYIGLAAGY